MGTSTAFADFDNVVVATAFLCPPEGCQEDPEDTEDSNDSEKIDPPTKSPPSSSGSNSKSGPSSGSGSAPAHKLGALSGVIPQWVSIVVPWWYDDKINDSEFSNIITYLLDENIIPSDAIKPDKQIDYLASSTKQLFMMWSNNNLAESYIVQIIDHYRHVGVW